ncbi:putative transcription factor interactor and regulator CCHC(Zn) family [Helianthus anomalus]
MELQSANPDTTVHIEVEPEPNPDSPTRVFKRIYICLDPLKLGFKECGRDILGLDGAFLKGSQQGQVLVAVGLDSNNGLYPLAYAIAEAENKDSWTWFLECLKDDLALQNNSRFTFISDRQKGLIPALEKVFPAAEHRFCLRHIHQNMKLKWRGKGFKDCLWACATARTGWAQSDVLLNNMCEVLNAKTVEGREKPIISCLEFLREYLMKRIVNVMKVQHQCKGPLTPKITEILDEIKKAAAQCTVKWCGDSRWQVQGTLGQYVVNVEQKVCTCRRWEFSGIPCKHAVAVNWDMAAHKQQVGPPEDWVHPCYYLDTWKKAYAYKVGPINGPKLWPISLVPTTLTPPLHHKQAGRPKKKRRRDQVEIEDAMEKKGKLTKKDGTVTCKKCNVKGHNSRSCKGKATEGGSTNDEVAAVGSAGGSAAEE